MIELLNKYPISEILIFIFMLFIAIKEIFGLIDWVKERFKVGFKEDIKQKEYKKAIQYQLNNMTEENKIIKDTLKALEEQVDIITDNVNLLIASDKDDIKAYITERHHYFCYEQGWIDDYSLDCLEKRYEHYTAEGGNSFVSDLVKDIRDLPKQPPK